jgi:DNA-binding transcriptional MerR regulator
LDSQILKHLSQKFFTRERIREIIVHVNRELTERRNRNSTKLKALHQELEGTRARIRKHYEAIESGTLELGLVSERLKELKEWESEISRQLRRFQGPKQLPPYLFKDETLRKIQTRLDEIFMSNERGMAKEYLKFFLDRIEVNGRNINLVANTVALCNFSLIKKTGETSDVLTEVPPVVLSWLPG